MRFNIVLVEPEIPQNTGNIARTCAATKTILHLVKPLGFSTESKYMKRAGLDYWDKLDIFYYENLGDFFKKTNGSSYFFASTKSENNYSDMSYPPGSYLIFGKETAGLPEDILRDNREKSIRIPMEKSSRSLNLSNAAAIVLYEALRQNGFPNLLERGDLGG